MNYQEVIDELSVAILDNIKRAMEKSRFDKSFKAKVTEKINDSKYRVLYSGNIYTVSSHIILEADDIVRVCAPCNNWQDLFVICKTR